MCGIFAYTGRRQAAPVLVEGLGALEYRGYDSAGIYVVGAGGIRSVGAVEHLRAKRPETLAGTSGIAHLRWATHGEPSEQNAHPHADCHGQVWVVHNGIIENFRQLKEKLVEAGHVFASETDTEVLAHLIEQHLAEKGDFEAAVTAALREVRGTFGMAVACASEPEKLIAARLGAPVVLGLGVEENFIASDASPILRHTKDALFLHDGDIAVITPTTHRVQTLDHRRVQRGVDVVDWDVEQARKDGYAHFMLKEIMEGPEVVRNTTRGRLVLEQGLAKLGGLEAVARRLRSMKRMQIVGCGTASYAGMVGAYMLEEHAGIPVELDVGSEFRYRNSVLDEDTVLLAISQSGETADTLEAIREAKRKGALTLGIVNTVGSTIARETDAGIHNHAGPEIAVASTKAFVSQLTALALLTLFLGRQRRMSPAMGRRLVKALQALPEKMEQVLARSAELEDWAARFADCQNFLYIGRKYNFPIALEGALKLKEVSYLHAEGCAAGEMKHGPLAMLDEQFPTVAIAPGDSVYEKMLSNIQEIRARHGRVLALGTEGNEELREMTDVQFYLPPTLEMLTPLLNVVPLQLFAYLMAMQRGVNVDRPRNLAKSVTVE